MRRLDKVTDLLLLFLILILLLFAMGLQARTERFQFFVKTSDNGNVTVHPVTTPDFLIAEENGATADRGDVLTCTASPLKVGEETRSKTPIVLTELNCGQNGKFIVETVYFGGR